MSIPDSSLVLNEEHPIDGVGVAQLTCAIIHEEYEWELEHQHSAKDDSLLSKPPLFFHDLFGQPTIHYFACVSSSTDAPIIDHSQDSPDDGPSFENVEDKLFIENPLDLSSICSETERMSLFTFHLPLYLIHLIMRMSIKSLIFLIMAVVIHLFPYLITIMTLSQ